MAKFSLPANVLNQGANHLTKFEESPEIFVMRGSKLYAEFARRREIEQIKNEKLSAVDKYFEKWGKITSRYEQWTTPEYYKQAEEMNKNRELEKLKYKNLEDRREKLKKLLSDEMNKEESMMKDLNRPRSKQLSSEMLSSINETIKRTEEEKRRLELESRLYKKWRHGFCENTILSDSKSDHEALAKMNWLDRQVAEQLERDREKRDDEERLLRLQEEARKHEECLIQRKHLRDEEINSLKSFQSKHMGEIKDRQEESDKLRSHELNLIQRKQNIAEELEKLNMAAKRRKERISLPYNLRRIKMILRQRSNSIREDLKEDIDMLNRIILSYDSEQVAVLKEKFEMQFDMEIQKQTQIETMYESEAKTLLSQQEEIWNQEAAKREQMLRKLIFEQMKTIQNEIEYNVKRQCELINIKEQHLEAIENCSMRLKELLNDQSRDESRSSSRLSFDEVGKEKSNGESAKLNNFRISGPKFGRKKIAWT